MAWNVLMPRDAETLRCHMERQRGKLIDIIDSEYGLLNICLEKRVLSNSEIERIKDKTSRYEKKEQLLLFIANNEKEEDFLTALEESSQTHVANWIIADGNYKDEFGLDWPLTDTENEALDRNQRTLVGILDTCDLLNRLYSKEVINRWHREFIESKPTNHDKNEALLEIVRRLSRKGYSIFINCLRDSNQGHVADILENGGAIVPVHATLQGDNLDEAETQIVNEMTDFLCQRATSMEQANRLIAGLQLNIIAVKRGESIVLYIGCCTEEDLNHLRKIVDDRKMKEILEILFNLFIHKLGFRVIILLVNIFENDLAKAKETFKTMDVTDVQQFRYCVDCGRRLKRTDESKHMKCICGCEFCFVCLKKTEQVGSVKVLRCQLDDNCSAAPRQTKKSFNKPEGAEGWFGSASSKSSDPEPDPSQSAPLEPRSPDTRGWFEGWCIIL